MEGMMGYDVCVAASMWKHSVGSSSSSSGTGDFRDVVSGTTLTAFSRAPSSWSRWSWTSEWRSTRADVRLSSMGLRMNLEVPTRTAERNDVIWRVVRRCDVVMSGALASCD